MQGRYEDYAIVVGFSRYETYAVHEPTRFYRGPKEFYEWLVAPGGVPEKNVTVVGVTPEAEQSREIADEAFAGLLSVTGRRLYIYMSGFGREDQNGEIVVYPPATNHEEVRAMPAREYAEGIRKIGNFHEVVLFVDCDWLPADDTAIISPPFGASAASDRPFFYAWSEEKLPAFTRGLIQGLRGEAIDEKGAITSESLAKHLKRGRGLFGSTRWKLGGTIEFAPAPEIGTRRAAAPPKVIVASEGRPEHVAAHADDPAIIDELGRRPFAEVIGTRIIEVREQQEKRAKDRAESDLAFMVHLHGPWGSGKTSVLNFLRAHLQERGWVVVDFNAWRHQRLRPPWWALIRTIHTEAMRKLGFRQREVLSLKWLAWHARISGLPVLVTAALLAVAVLMSQMSVDVGAQLVTGLLTAVTALWAYSRSFVFGSSRAAQTYTELRSDPLGPIVTLFRNLIRAIRKPVVVFIDDLDRCDSRYVIDLIEGIQTLFRSAPVTYVVAADRKWICASFDQTYSEFTTTVGDPGRPLGYLFLEKVFQVSASVPRLSVDVRDAYWAGLLRGGERGDPRSLEEKRRAAEEQAAQAVRGARTHEQLEQAVQAETGDAFAKAAIRAAAAKQITTPAAREETEHRLQPFASLLEPNPRAMKRLVNAYGLHQAAHFLEGRTVAPEALARWTIIELRWPLLADHLAAQPDAIASVGTPAGDGVPEALRPLFTNQEVCAVAGVAPGDGAPLLDQRAIRSIVGP